MSRQIKLLKRARKRIKDGRSWFVCHALDDCVCSAEDQVAYDIIKEHINILLCGTISLDAWLANNYPGKYNTDDDDMMCKTRIAWIDYMIKEIETNGPYK